MSFKGSATNTEMFHSNRKRVNQPTKHKMSNCCIISFFVKKKELSLLALDTAVTL